MNVEKGPLADMRVRQAIRLALDVDQMLAAGYNGKAPRLNTLLPPQIMGHWKDAPVYKRNVAEAKSLLAAAGASNLKLKLLVLNQANYQSMALVARALLADAGITIEVDAQEGGTFWNSGKGDIGKNIDLFMIRFNGKHDPNFIMQWFVAGQIGNWNWQRWNSPEFDALYTQAAGELDPAKRRQLVVDAQRVMDKSSAFVWLTNEANAVVSPQLAEARGSAGLDRLAVRRIRRDGLTSRTAPAERDDVRGRATEPHEMMRYVGSRLLTTVLIVFGAMLLLFTLSAIVPGDPATTLLGPQATPETSRAVDRRHGARPAAADAAVAIFRERGDGKPGHRRDLGPLGRGARRRGASLHADPDLLGDRPRRGARHAARHLRRHASRLGARQRPRVRFGRVHRRAELRRRDLPAADLRRSGSTGCRCWAQAAPARFGDEFKRMILPTVALALGWIGFIARLVRTSMLEVMGEPYIRTSRAYGLPESPRHLQIRAQERLHPDDHDSRHGHRPAAGRRGVRRDRLRAAGARDD